MRHLRAAQVSVDLWVLQVMLVKWGKPSKTFCVFFVQPLKSYGIWQPTGSSPAL